MNLLLILGAFAAFGFTLTLPGIAGIVLTVGMAVDANVLILERMREELRTGEERARGRRHRLRARLERDLRLQHHDLPLGTDPVPVRHRSGQGVRGDPVLGILTTMTTAVFLTRVVYDWLVIDRRMTAVSI